jgi:uncharacterized membrane protein
VSDPTTPDGPDAPDGRGGPGVPDSPPVPVAPSVGAPLDAGPVAEGTDTADLWVFVLSPVIRAQEALLACTRLAAKGHLRLEDAAIATNVRGRVRIQQTRDINPSQGALGGAWLGTLAGLFAGLPFVGAALGAAAGGLMAKLRDYGIDDAAMKRIAVDLGDDEAALFLLVQDCHRVRVLHEVGRFPARLLRSTADPDVVTAVQERLAIDPWGD